MTLTSSGVVMVVDDDLSMRTAIGRLLNAAGIHVASYASAEALLAAGPVLGARCVVSDFKLPAMSGLDLVTELRTRGGWPPVIVITAHDEPELRDQALRCGAAGYLCKPFAGKALLAAISAIDNAALADSPASSALGRSHH